MLKKILSEILVFFIALSHVQIFASNQESNVEDLAVVLNDGVLLVQDFEKGSDNVDLSGSTLEIMKTSDNNRAFAYSAGKGGTAYMGKYFNEDLPKGLYKLSFDWYTDSVGRNVQIRLLNENAGSLIETSDNTSFAIGQIAADGYFDLRRKISTWNPPDFNISIPYEAKKWYKWEFWIDTQNREIDIFLNGEKWLTMPLPEVIQSLRGFAVASYSSGIKDDFMYFDNVEFVKIDNIDTARVNPIFVKAEAPDNIIGNNFSKDNPVRFELTLTNRTDKAADVKLFYRVYTNYEPELVWSGEAEAMELSLGAGETIKHNMKLEKELFGRFNLNIVTVVDGKEYVRAVPYTMSNRTKDMPTNKNAGVAGHIASRGGVETSVKLINHLGIGWLRDNYGLGWANVEKTKGVYNFTEEMDQNLNLLDEYDINLILLWEGGNAAVYPDPVLGTDTYIFPTTEEGVRALENFMKKLAEFADGRIAAVECYNEYQNMSLIYKPELQHMVNYHKAIYKGIKAGDPNLKVIGGNVDEWVIETYFPTILKGIKGETTLDGIANHPYHPTQGTPDKGGVVKDLIMRTDEILAEHGFKPGLPHYMTENGWTESLQNFDKKRYASFEVRSMAHTLACGEELNVDTVNCTYTLHNYTFHDNRARLDQAHFGLYENYEGASCEIPYLGKEVVPAMAYYNGLVADGELVGNVETDYGEDAFAYRYKLRGGEDLLMLGPIDPGARLTFAYDLGTSSITVGDLYGNEQTFCSDNGIYTFETSEYDILYIRGNFGKIEKAEAKFTPESFNLEVPINYTKDFEVKTPASFEGTAYITCNGLEVENAEVPVSDGRVNIKLFTKEEKAENAKVQILIKDNKGNNVYETIIPVVYKESAALASDIKYRLSGERYDLWDMHFSIRNIREDIPVSGTISVLGSDKKYVLPEIKPLELRKIVIPKEQVSNISELGTLSAKIELSTGEVIPIEESGAMNGVIYADNKPVIDGIISSGEWDDVGLFTIEMDKAEYTYSTTGNGEKSPWTGPEDAKVEFYSKYDEENLYIGAKVYDDIYRQVNSYDRLWNGDSMQILLGRDVESVGTQYGIGLDKDGVPRIYRNKWEGWKSGLGIGAVAGLYEKGEVAITRDGVWTYYEARLPLADFSVSGLPINPGDYMYFDVLYNDDDGKDREYWLDLSDNAIGSGGCMNRNAVRSLFIPKK